LLECGNCAESRWWYYENTRREKYGARIQNAFIEIGDYVEDLKRA
jgi:hypothetical protein